MAFQYEGGDHVILVGEVLEFDHSEREPLAFKGGRYAFAVHKAEERAAAEAATDAANAPGASSPDFLIYQLGRIYHQLLMRMQPELDLRKLGIPEYFALHMLGTRDGRSLAELDALLSHSGVRIDNECGRKLLGLGLVSASGAAVETRLSLTAAGQRTLVELMAVAKAAGDDAESGFDPGESRLLRQFLGRLVTASDPDRT